MTNAGDPTQVVGRESISRIAGGSPGEVGWVPPGRPEAVEEDDIFTVTRPARSRVPVLAVLIVALLLAAGGVWWFAFQGDDSPTPPGGQQAAAPASLEDAVAKLPGLPGRERNIPVTMPLDGLVEEQLLPQPTVDVLREAGVTEVGFRGTTEVGVTVSVFVVPGDREDVLRDHQAELGLAPVRDSGLADGVGVYRIATDDGVFRRGVYRTNGFTVVMDSSELGKDVDENNAATFAEMADRVLGALPPS
ncbi:hypothetical protein [Actinokineospora pegani]|uniref:hypothetical protein n=1 Tax=Actinokineospora pegani TaxID=2654637 RepID=UPI0012E9C8E2|nr:hypothetical protein [Actinokineospora pegani]